MTVIVMETPVERALKKGCRMLSNAYDYRLCSDEMYFDLINDLDAAIEQQRRVRGMV